MDQKTILILAAVGVGGYILYNRNNSGSTTPQPTPTYPTAAQYAAAQAPTTSTTPTASGTTWLQTVGHEVTSAVEIFNTIKTAVGSVKASTPAASAPTTAGIVPDDWSGSQTATS